MVVEQGLDEAFTCLVTEQQQVLVALARWLTVSREEAEDLGAETFLRAWRQVVQTEAPPPTGAEARAWLATVMLNEQRNRARTAARRAAIPGGDVVGEAVSGDLAATVTDRTMLEVAIDRLPRAQRIAVLLRGMLDLPAGQVAQVMGCSEVTTRTHLARGLAGLRRQLEGMEP